MPISSETYNFLLLNRMGDDRMEYRDIKGFEGYYKISEYGDILNVRTGRIRKLKPNVTHGYLEVDLYKNGKAYYKRINRLVAENFLDDVPENIENYVVMHLDNNKLNNHYSNLKWGTISENTQQAYDDNLITLVNKIPCLLIKDRNNYIEFDTIKSLCEFIGIGDYAVHTCMKNHSKIKKGKYKGWYIESN